MGWLIDLAEAALSESMPERGARLDPLLPLSPAAESVPADPLWWRVSILEPGARTVEVDTPSGWTLADWQAYAERYHGPGCSVTPLVPLPKPRATVTLDEALGGACEGVAGITPTQFRSLLCSEDIKDIEAGGIHPKTLHAYALSFAEGIRSGRIVALPERKGAKPAPLWGSVAITEAEIEAARKGRTVVRQGTFAGSQEVKACRPTKRIERVFANSASERTTISTSHTDDGGPEEKA